MSDVPLPMPQRIARSVSPPAATARNAGAEPVRGEQLIAMATHPTSLSIERLRIDGLALSPAQGTLLQHALESELQQLMRAGHQVFRSDPHADARAQTLHYVAGDNPAKLGAEIARSIYAAMLDSATRGHR